MKTDTHPMDYQVLEAPTAETTRQLADWLAAAGVTDEDTPEVRRRKILEYITRINAMEAL